MMKQLVEFAPGESALSPTMAPAPLASKRIVALGGGTGLSTLLRGLRPLCFNPGEQPGDALRERLTAVVTVADDGGSSGSLRRAYQVLAPGDIRSCLLALSGCDPTLQALFGYRFDGEVGGHSLGNLILTALAKLECNFTRAVEVASEILHVQGQVLPATPDDVQIRAEFADGSQLQGESSITGAGRRIRRVSLVPSCIRMLAQTRSAIEHADMIIIGPGSLYTSLLPTLLVPGMAEAIARSSAKVVVVMNLMTEPGETDGYAARDFLTAIERHLPGFSADYAIFNSTPLEPALHEQYLARGSVPVNAEAEQVEGLNCVPLLCDLLEQKNRIRHDPDKLARAILELA